MLHTSLISDLDLSGLSIPVAVACILGQKLDVTGRAVDQEEVVWYILDDPGRDEGALEMRHCVMCLEFTNWTWM